MSSPTTPEARRRRITGDDSTADSSYATAATAAAGRAVPYVSVAERAARGKAARSEVPRSSHAAYEPQARRGDPVKLLERQAKTRVPELVPIRYGRMLVSPFTFYRGAAMIMASDLAATPRSGLTVQCCGDAHLSNFGVFASPERRLVFDLNDFDETLPGPWEWDVKRLAVSMLIAARDNGYKAKDQERIVLATVAGYREAMAELRRDGQSRCLVRPPRDRDRARGARAAARSRGWSSAPGRRSPRRARRTACRRSPSWCAMVDGEARIVAEPPLIVPVEDLAEGGEREELLDSLQDLLRSYREHPGG